MKKLTIILLCICTTSILPEAIAQHFKDKIKKELAFESPSKDNVFYLSNINGHITVEGYDGDKILLEAERILYAKTDARLARAKEEIGVGVIDRVDTIIVFMQGPCGNFSKRSQYKDKDKVKNKWKNKVKKAGWGYNWNNCEYEYDFKLNFTLKVPRNQNIFLSTVNDGDIAVGNIQGTLNIHNVNGAIALKKVSGETYARTVNGDVDLDYTKAPNQESYYYTLNGDINAYYPKGLKADLTFKSFNGDFYTNIEKVEHRPMVLKQKPSREKGVAFKVDATSIISVGGGGTLLAFETFNGDVYIKEKQ